MYTVLFSNYQPSLEQSSTQRVFSTAFCTLLTFVPRLLWRIPFFNLKRLRSMWAQIPAFRGNMVSRNVVIRLFTAKASCPIRMECSGTQLPESQSSVAFVWYVQWPREAGYEQWFNQSSTVRYATTNDARANECYIAQFFPIKSGCYN
jgi:hypothetical protein